MQIKRKKFHAGKFAACALLAAVMTASGICGTVALESFADDNVGMYFNKIAAFDTGNTNADGGTAEIVHYNSDNNKMYLVNGADQSIDIISLESYGSDEAKTVFDENADRVKLADIVADHSESFAEGFEVGDISSVAVSTDLKIVAVAVQHSDYSAKGAVVLLDYDGNFVAAYQTGVQPDNVCISGNYILTADEGEPREGYTNGTDPKGSVTIVSGLTVENLTGGAAKQVYFDNFDSQRDSLTENGVIIMKGADPSYDFEPEYIVSSGNGYAYVSLQEANAIAILDIEGGEFTAVQSLGFKDHSQDGNGLDLIEDGKINIKTEDVYGVYMPDGMDIYTAADGATYLITANEGDAREWGEFSGVTKVKMYDENGENSTKVEVLDNSLWDGLDENCTYVLGGRSFSVFKVTENSIEMVYDSGDDIEQTIAASDYSAYFNCNNDDVSLDARSKKKGPEPEDVTVYEYDGKVCVSVCMERQSGFVTFDISAIVGGQSSENAAAESLGYTTTRDFSANMAGDVAPENLEYVEADENALGKDLIIMANENSGTVSVYAIESEQKTYELHSEYVDAENSETQSTEGSVLITSYFGSGNNTDGAYNYSFVTIANNSGEEIDLSGWTIQYKSSKSSANWQSFTLETVLNIGGTYTVVCVGAGNSYTSKVTLSESDYDAMWSGLKYFDNKTASIKIVDADGNTVDALGIYCADESYLASDEEGEGNLVDDISKNKVIYRNSNGGVYTDTGDNADDFSVTSKLSSASSAKAYAPTANENAMPTAYVAVICQNAEISGIDYLASGYVLAGEISFTVTPEKDYKVVSVTVDDNELESADGVYSFTLEGDCTITVTCESVYAFELNEGGTYTLTGINDDGVTEIIIPSEYNGIAVTAIASGAFKNNTSITYLYIPESISEIGNSAFYGCTNLTGIYYGAASVTLAASNYIFYQAGQSGAGIAVTIGNAVEQIPAYLFNPYGVSESYAPKIVSVVFEEESSCESIGDRAFAFCASITSVALPDSVQTLGEYVFYGCSALESASFGSNLTTIGTRVFYSCTALKSVTFADNFGWYKGQSSTLTNNGYAVCVDVSDAEANAANFISTSGWLSYKLIKTDNVISYYVDGELYGAACYSTAITSKQFTNLKSALSVTTVPSKTCYKGAWDISVTYKTLQGGGSYMVTAVYTVNHTLENITANAATCTADGNIEYWYCSVCGKYFSNESGEDETEISLENTIIEATGHDYEIVVTEPTCTEQGYTTYICKVCGDSYVSDETEATGHSYEIVVTAPTCTENGYTTYTCTVCGDSYVSDETEATGHDYEIVVTAPTCTENGYTTYTCTVCGDSYVSDETEATGHDYEIVVTAPTCTENGYTTYTCTVCGDSYVSDETEATGHDYEIVVTEPTCIENGYTTYTCTVCGDSYVSDETEATGHDYESVITEPTCMENGYTTYTCTVCGDSYVSDETEAKGHDYEIVVTAPTCTEQGYTAYICNVCGDSYTDNYTEAHGHRYAFETVAPTCTEQGYTTYTCGVCGDSYVGNKIEAKGHSYVSLITEPTCTEQGYTTYTCIVCGDNYIGNYVEATGHKYSITVTEPTCTEQGYTTYACSVCGESYIGNSIEASGHSYVSVVTEPACTEQGYTTYTCSVCGESYTGNYVEANGHKYSSVVTEPTCIEQGYTTYTCTVCGDSYAGNNIEATGHSYVSVVTEPACTEQGHTTYTCTVCGDNYIGNNIEATGHSYESETTEPTCTEQGYTTYTCTVCGESYTGDKIEATGHSYVSVVTEPTCTEQGYTKYTCSVCGESYIGNSIEASGHSYVSVVTEPTCTEQGYTTYTCTVCGDNYIGNYVEANGHKYSITVTEPTCTEQGYTAYTCSVCGESYIGNYVEANGHKYSSVVTEPTCTEQDYTTYACSVCGDSYIGNKIEAKGHSYVSVIIAPTCTEKGYTTNTCTVCGNSYVSDETKATGHTWNDGEVTTEAACTSDGIKTFTCSICGTTKTETIKATGHSYESVITAPTCTEKGYTTYTCTVCRNSYVSDETEATGHKYSLTSWTWDGISSASALLTCENDGHTETATAVITSEVTTAATETTSGVITYTATVTFEGETYTVTKTETIPATGTSDGEDDKTDGDASGSDIADADSGSGCATIISGGGSSNGGDLYLVLSVIAMIAIAAAVSLKKGLCK